MNSFFDGRSLRRSFAIGVILVGAACSSVAPTSQPEELARSESQALEIDPLTKYAMLCAAEIGFMVPDFNCDAGDEVPVTLNGVRLDVPDGAFVAKCDRPNHLNRECDPGS